MAADCSRLTSQAAPREERIRAEESPVQVIFEIKE